MILTKEVETKWSPPNKELYISKGYIFTKMRDSVVVKVEDLKVDSHVKVDVLCDYCKKVIINKEYRNTFKNKKYVNKDCCINCIGLKNKEVNAILYDNDEFNNNRQLKRKATSLIKYGCDFPSQSQEVKNKIKANNLIKYGFESHNQSPEIKLKKENVCLEKYGVTSPLLIPEVKDKIAKTNLDKFGFKYPMQNDVIKQKTFDTNIIRYGSKSPFGNSGVMDKTSNTVKEKYGVDNISQLQSIKDKKVRTTISNYGVEHHMQDKDIQTKSLMKRNETMYKNGTIACSSQQLYLNSVINGMLNYPVSHITLDIKLDDNFYVEYDGGGHDLNVKLNQISQAEFNNKEIKRYLFLKSLGWKMIRIISSKDNIPSDEIIIKIINDAKDFLNTGHSWIKFDIDNSKVLTSQYEKPYDFGKLRKINAIGFVS